MKKSTSELGMQQREAGVLSYAKDYLDKSVNEPYYQVKDPEGKGIYELKFVNMFYGQLDEWRNANKNMADFPLFDQKKLDQMLTTLRPRAKINEFQIASGAPAILHLKVDPEAITPSTTLSAIGALNRKPRCRGSSAKPMFSPPQMRPSGRFRIATYWS